MPEQTQPPIGDPIPPSAPQLGALELRPLLEVPDYVHRVHAVCHVLQTVALVLVALFVIASLASRQAE